MADFNEREKAFEAKFKLDEELKFKATARRNRLLGHWAGEKMGFSEAECDAYAKEVIKSDFEEPGDQDIIRKVKKDFNDSSVAITEKEIEERLKQFYDKAIAEISS